MDFLPADYQTPDAGRNYMRLDEGENRIRILTRPLLGWVDWQNNRPIRNAFDDKPAVSNDPNKPVRHFWAFVVFNYAKEEIQILEITQATIKKSIEALCKDKDWGAPYGYDIKIIRSGSDTTTKYVVNPIPHKPVDGYIIKCFYEKPCYLPALLRGGDPFSDEWIEKTPLAFPHEGEDVVTMEQGLELQQKLEECPASYQSTLLKTLKELPQKVTDIRRLPRSLYDRVISAIEKNRQPITSTLPF